MITVRIKSSAGIRTEEWDDWRIKGDSADFVHNNEAYGIESQQQDGSTTVFIVAKYFWVIHEELDGFGTSPDTSYIEIPKFVRSVLEEIGSILNEYVQIEFTFQTVNVSMTDSLEEYKTRLTDLRGRSFYLYEEVEVIRPHMLETQIQNEQEEALQATLLALSDFTMSLYDSVQALLSIVSGLSAKSHGQKYEPVQYMKELKVLECVITRRHQLEKRLQETREQYIFAFPSL